MKSEEAEALARTSSHSSSLMLSQSMESSRIRAHHASSKYGRWRSPAPRAALGLLRAPPASPASARVFGQLRSSTCVAPTSSGVMPASGSEGSRREHVLGVGRRRAEPRAVAASPS